MIITIDKPTESQLYEAIGSIWMMTYIGYTRHIWKNWGMLVYNTRTNLWYVDDGASIYPSRGVKSYDILALASYERTIKRLFTFTDKDFIKERLKEDTIYAD